ncbi:MAG: DNA-3-methyladenine glycosylase I [Glaciecola sp.]
MTSDGLITGSDGNTRCGWPGELPDYVAYHDTEWGVQVRTESGLYEKLTLEGFQSGLSWLTILRKRDRFREVFADFDAGVVSGWGETDVLRLLGDAGIVRHRGKIESTINNAGAIMAMRAAGESLVDLIWSYAPPPRPRPTSTGQVPAQTIESKALAKDLKKRGFRFVGPTTAYALMQSQGLVDDHIEGCFVTPLAAPKT